MHAHHLCDDFNRAFGTEASTRPNVHSLCNGAPSLLSVSRHVRACEQLPYRPQHAVQRRPLTRDALLSVFFSAGLCSQPWKVLANWSWAG